MADFYWKKSREKMKDETKKEIIDLIRTGALCAVAIAIVFHLNSMFASDKTAAEKEQKITQNDSIRTDSVPTVNFVKNQIQQKVK